MQQIKIFKIGDLVPDEAIPIGAERSTSGTNLYFLVPIKGELLECGTVEKCGCAVCEKKLCHNKKEEVNTRYFACDKYLLEVDCILPGKALFNRKTPKDVPLPEKITPQIFILGSACIIGDLKISEIIAYLKADENDHHCGV